ncbi:Serine carboxypeptidase-like 49 [Glycine soja]|uniref:Serine carboxypeptidase-like 49 n=1 Tax=Glycine soja TaxID=3848 RepID=A0A445JY16_GLYSO|nr:Serine carboxypeptidase-like 49 [Glycine soja]
MFYFFFESQSSKNDCVVISLTRGPRCSNELGLFCSNGPFQLTKNLSLEWNDYGWDKTNPLGRVKYHLCLCYLCFLIARLILPSSACWATSLNQTSPRRSSTKSTTLVASCSVACYFVGSPSKQRAGAPTIPTPASTLAPFYLEDHQVLSSVDSGLESAFALADVVEAYTDVLYPYSAQDLLIDSKA